MNDCTRRSKAGREAPLRATDQEASLDELAGRARDGDSLAEKRLFEALRVRFLDVAKRRVREEDREDLTQDALRIVHAKLVDRPRNGGVLPWAFVILRNVIGNYYRKRDRQGQMESYRDDILPRTEEPDDLSEVGDRVVEAIALLERRHAKCGRIFRSILASLAKGGSANEVSGRAWRSIREIEPTLTRGGFYTALHRCRARLRTIVRELEDGKETAT